MNHKICALIVMGIFAGSVFAAVTPGKPEKPAAAPPPPNAPAEPEGMKPLFNGKDLTGWVGYTTIWSVKDGVIHGETTKENAVPGNTFLIYSGGTTPFTEFKDFELRFSFKQHGGNSGMQYRSKHLVGHKDNAWVVTGYQAEIAGIPGKDGYIYHEKGPDRGYPGHSKYLCWPGDKVELGEDGVSKSVGSVGENSAIGAALKLGDWNDYIIIAKGNHIVQYINGVQTVDFTDNDVKNRLMSGIIALQIHHGEPMTIEFRDIRIKELSGD